MKLLKQAEQLLDNPVTLDSLREWDKLCGQARGDEAQHIGDLYETLLNKAPDEVYDLWMEETVNQSQG